MSGPLDGKVALVAGATRGAGRGIAVALGEAGATSTAPAARTRAAALGVRPAGDDRGDRRAGRPRPAAPGIAVAVDHLEPGAGRGARRSGSTPSRAASTCWSTTSGAASSCSSGTRRSGSTTSTTGCGCCASAIDTHLITSHFALPLLIRQPGGLVVEMTDGTARLQRRRTTGVSVVLRPGQDGGASGWRSRRRTSSAPHGCDRRGAHARAGCARR